MKVSIQYMPRHITNPDLTQWQEYEGVAAIRLEKNQMGQTKLILEFEDYSHGRVEWLHECVKKWEVINA